MGLHLYDDWEARHGLKTSIEECAREAPRLAMDMLRRISNAIAAGYRANWHGQKHMR